MTEIKQIESGANTPRPADVHKKWVRTTVTAATLAGTTLTCSTTYLVTLYAAILEKSVEASPNMTIATANAIHGTAQSLGVGGMVGYVGTILLFLGSAAAACDEFTHYNE